MAVILGVPLYANIAGVMPIPKALVNKGMLMETVLSLYHDSHSTISV